MSNILRRLSNKNNAQCAFWVIRWPCSQNGSVVQSVPDTIKRRGGYRGIFREEGEDIGSLEITKMRKNVLSAHSNKLGQIYVQWDTKTQILI